MTPRHSKPPAHRAPLALPRIPLTRRLVALLQLALTVAVPPALLLTLVGNPLDVPATLRSSHALTRAVDDRSILWLIALTAWALYAHLVASLVVEGLRQTRGSTLRQPLPGLLFGANAALASHLIASLVLTPHLTSGPGAGSVGALTPAVVRTALATPQITDLTSDAHPPLPPATAAAAGSGGLLQCRVLPPDGRDHDTLWDIAERHLGDGTRWRDIYDLNEGRLMPDGQRFTRASHIHPGWILTLPADAIALDDDRVIPLTATAPPPEVVAPHSLRETAPQHVTERAPVDPDLTGAERSDALRPATEPMPPHGSLPARNSGIGTSWVVAEPGGAAADEPVDGESPRLAAPVTGVLGLAALGLLAALTRRRKVAARRRPPGARAALPAPELLAEEQRIRHEARLADDTCATVRLALLLASKSTPGVQLSAVWQHPDGSLELCWAKAPGTLEVPAPFTPTGRGWLLPASAHRLLYATRQDGKRRQDRTARLQTELDGRSDPFPLLLPIGSHHGSGLLVNLETFGLISLTTEPPPSDSAGDDNAAATAVQPLELLGAWVQALAGAPWADPIRIYLPAEIDALTTGHEYVTAQDTIQPTHGELLPEDLELIRQAGSFSAARRLSPGIDELISELYAGYPLAQLPPEVLAAATDHTQPVLALLLEPHSAAHRWTLRADGRLTIPGIAEDLTPLRLDPARQERLLRLLEHAQDPPQAAPDNPHRALLREQCPPAVESNEAPTGSADTTPVPAAPGDATAAAGGQGRTASLGEEAPSVDRPASGTASRAQQADPDPNFAGPMEIGVLGAIVVTGPTRRPPREASLELLVYMAFHRRPLTGPELWQALWPDDPYQPTTARTRRSDLKRFIKPLLISHGHRYCLDELVKTDWQRFQALAEGNPAQQLAALALVRGRPFQNSDQLEWIHLEGQFAEIEASIVDLALEIGQRAMRARDYDAARTAALAGLRGAPFEERLYRIAMQSAAARGASSELHQLRRQLSLVLDEELEPDDSMQPATQDLLQTLDDQQHRRAYLQRRRGQP